MSAPATTFREVTDITADELLAALRDGGHYGPQRAVRQVELFRRLGGDPDDHRYAYLSFRTRELRRRGIPIGSSRRIGIWLKDNDTEENE
ncbi:hypothetical protein [Micromonospora sp. WMMD736]|uniref:hypothetical protein n=1 Tax=Micromonospora sp. WMMD736 TaxID=3404112 RepID=UPI003B933B44